MKKLLILVMLAVSGFAEYPVEQFVRYGYVTRLC